MGSWINIWSFLQVIMLVCLTISVITSTIYIIAQLSTLDEADLYKKYQIDMEKKNMKAELTKREVYVASWLIKGSVLFVIPACLLIYRSRLVQLQAFTTLKKHQGMRTGVAYNPCLQALDYLFCLSRLRKKNYIDYIVYMRKNKENRSKVAEKASLWILGIWLFIQFYYNDLHDLFLTPLYMLQVLLLLFQKFALFLIKIILFPFIFGFYALVQCVCYNSCRCSSNNNRIKMRL